ncbi:hypothetical protein GIB67_018160 [Kingdonia uniflora]|uniref:Uncharacterized protein n=1 Tax=Kingdonia uniflora TaxID=39325 RepID=A0A7J7NMS0_9MAGN|nr:hypothetical protein GIB67_018160 [Kingdonia uniflora]
MNLKTQHIELKTMKNTSGHNLVTLRKCADFVHTFMLGFDIKDALRVLRSDQVYVHSFNVKYVKVLKGNCRSCVIRRFVDKGNKTVVKNATMTRFVVEESEIHILGSCLNIKYAKRDFIRSIRLRMQFG